jgi:hypothetical protein
LADVIPTPRKAPQVAAPNTTIRVVITDVDSTWRLRSAEVTEESSPPSFFLFFLDRSSGGKGVSTSFVSALGGVSSLSDTFVFIAICVIGGVSSISDTFVFIVICVIELQYSKKVCSTIANYECVVAARFSFGPW